MWHDIDTSDFDEKAYRESITGVPVNQLVDLLVREARLRAQWEHRAIHRERDTEENEKFIRQLMVEKKKMSHIANRLCVLMQYLTDSGECDQ